MVIMQIPLSPPFPRIRAVIRATQKIKADPQKFANRPGDREAAEEALERNFLVNGFISLFTEETSFSTIRFVTHNLQRTAILKLPKLAVCPFAPEPV